MLGLGAVGGQDVGGLPSSRCCARSDAARSADEQWCDPRCPQPRPAQSTQQALRGASVFLSNVYCFRGILALQPNRGERAGSSRTPRRHPPVSPTARTPGWHVRDARGTCTALVITQSPQFVSGFLLAGHSLGLDKRCVETAAVSHRARSVTALASPAPPAPAARLPSPGQPLSSLPTVVPSPERRVAGSAQRAAPQPRSPR